MYFCCKDYLPSWLWAEHRTRKKEKQQQQKLTQRQKHWNLVAYKGAWPTMQDQAFSSVHSVSEIRKTIVVPHLQLWSIQSSALLLLLSVSWLHFHAVLFSFWNDSTPRPCIKSKLISVIFTNPFPLATDRHLLDCILGKEELLQPLFFAMWTIFLTN